MDKNQIKNEIYQNGFFFMLGIVITVIILSFSFNRETPSKEVIREVHDTIKIVQKDSIKKTAYVPLNDSTLKLELKKNNIKHSDVVLAQAKLETGHFTSRVTKSHNNIFGIRTGKNYRKYEKWQDCVADYKKSIQSRYTGGNYYAFLEKIGYAEDKNYCNKLRELV